MPSAIPPFPVWPRPVRQFMRSLGISAQGMATQQRFLEVIAANLANSETTRTPEGGPYQRQVAVAGAAGPNGGGSVQVVADDRPGRMLYDPGHPDADESGFVRYPNVDVNTELVDLMIARRVHEANASVFQAAKAMLKRALEI
jgi:flagellar basal-body rod protein FlgC